MNTLERIRHHKIIAIIRGANSRDVMHIAKALHAGGIRILEITMNSEDPLRLIKELSVEFGDNMVIGAGTVLDPETAIAAMDAGAEFILSPIVNTKTIEATKRNGAIAVPGAYTPTEIVHAYQSGGDIIKVFPARPGPAYIKDILGPLPYIPLLPTGGVNLNNAKEFMKAGSIGLGIGSSLVDTSVAISDQYLQALTEKAKNFIQEIKLS